MGLNWVQATEAVVSITELKDQLRLEHTDEDTYLDSLRLAATQFCERYTDRAFVQRAGFILTLERFPPGGRGVALSPNPVVQVDSTQYTDTAGTLGAYGGTVRFYGGETHEPAIVLPQIGQTWPDTVSGTPQGVMISFTAGYGATVNDTPEPLRHAVLQLATHWYEHRSAVSEGKEFGTVAELPLHVRSTLQLYSSYGGEPGGYNWKLAN